MDLNRRLAKLETAGAVRQARVDPVYSDEDRAIMQRIINRIYADPVRNANRIADFERIIAKGAATESVVKG